MILGVSFEAILCHSVIKDSSQIMTMLTGLRILRILRMTRVVRAVRFMNIFRSLVADGHLRYGTLGTFQMSTTKGASLGMLCLQT